MGRVGKPKGLRCMDPERIERRAAEMRDRMSRRPLTEAERQERNRESCKAYYRRRVEADVLPVEPDVADYLRLLKIECSGGPSATNMGSTLTESHSICLPPSSSRGTFREMARSDRDLLQSLRGTGYHL